MQCSELEVAAGQPVIQRGLPARPAAAKPAGCGALSASHLTTVPTGELFGIVQPARRAALLPI